MKRSFFIVTAIAALVAAAPARSEVGTVCAGTAAQGVICLRAAGVQHFTRLGGRLPSNAVADIKACGNNFVISVGTHIVEYDGAHWSPPVRLPEGHAARLSCTERGGTWFAHQGGAGYWDGGHWTYWRAAQIAPKLGRTAVLDIAAGPEKTAWALLAGGHVAHFEKGRWTVRPAGAGPERPRLGNRVLVDREGRLWLPVLGGLLSLANGKWEFFEGPGLANAMAFGGPNSLWLASGTRLRLFGRGEWHDIDAPHGLRAIAADADAAVWAATEFGLARLRNGAWETRQMHNSELPDNDLTAIATIGGTVPLPDAISKQPGTLTGRLAWSDGAAMTGAALQICPVPAGPADLEAGQGPCDGRPLARLATTDAEGAFRIADLPPSNYRLAVKPAGRDGWLRDYAADDRLRLLSAQTREIGTFIFDVRFRQVP